MCANAVPLLVAEGKLCATEVKNGFASPPEAELHFGFECLILWLQNASAGLGLARF
jgi:hypothetical protein